MGPLSANPSKKRKLNDECAVPIEAKLPKPTTTTTTNKADTATTASSTVTNNTKASDDKDNEDANKWQFKASDFTFGDNHWVKQTSDPSINSTTPTLTTTNDKQETTKAEEEIVPNDDPNNSFLGFVGEGFGKELESKKQEENESKTSSDDKKNPWAQNWSGSNADGSFKLNFEWGTWEDSNTKIDLNLSNKIGYGSEAKKYDPNEIKPDEKTKAVLESMTGEQDAGDADDEVIASVHCKVFCLENGKYIERGKGMVHVNTYCVDEKKKARILCRRDQILTTIVNAPILKEMKFEKTGSYLRFGVLEQVVVKKSKDEKKEKEEDKEDNEDDDIVPKVVSYLLKPRGGGTEKVDELLTKINKLQETL